MIRFNLLLYVSSYPGIGTLDLLSYFSVRCRGDRVKVMRELKKVKTEGFILAVPGVQTRGFIPQYHYLVKPFLNLPVTIPKTYIQEDSKGNRRKIYVRERFTN